jgi:Icc-related predicted phosphoesterase
MKILMLADLHSRRAWFEWIAGRQVDAVLIAGDLLDGFSSVGPLPQMAAVRDWAARLNIPLALSSGNHDGNYEASVPVADLSGIDPTWIPFLAAPRWMDTLERPGVVVDARSAVVDWGGQPAVVSTIPFSPGMEGPAVCSRLWDQGAHLRRTGHGPWFVLHHEPPEATAVGGTMGDPALTWKIEEYQPDFVLSGHLHAQPYTGSFADRIGRTWCFNPGAPILSKVRAAAVPNHILLDTEARTATWFATPSTGRTSIEKTLSLQ